MPNPGFNLQIPTVTALLSAHCHTTCLPSTQIYLSLTLALTLPPVQVDSDGSGTIEFEEFVAMMTKHT